MDTEEGIDLAFYRPIGFAWAYLFRKLGVHPNTVTIASIIIGIAAGVCFYYNSLAINIAGMLLLVWANSYDSADGQLARMTGQYSPIGRILDGLSGDLWFITIYTAICLREDTFSPFFASHPWLIWVIAAITGACHAKQAAMADYYRQFHLFFVNGSAGSELDRADELKRRVAQLSWRNDFWHKITQTFYTQYTVNQEAMTPAMQALRHEIAAKWPDGKLPYAFKAHFRALSLPLMKYTNILSFNWRTIALFISLFIGQPWLYFMFELIVLNFLLVYMMRRHERLCHTLTTEIKEGRYND